MFEYSKEWYGGEYIEPWIGRVTSVEALKAEYVRQERYRVRLANWFEGQELSGLSLELGFNDGKSVHWLSGMFPELEFDLLDWNESLKTIEPFIREISPVRNVFYGDVLDVHMADEYENIFSLDFFEHLPLEVYFDALGVCDAMLVPGGRLWVYLAGHRGLGHVNLRRDQDTANDLRAVFGDITERDKMFCATKC